MFISAHFKERLFERFGLPADGEWVSDMLAKMKAELAAAPPAPGEDVVYFDCIVNGTRFTAIYRVATKVLITTVPSSRNRMGQKKFHKFVTATYRPEQPAEQRAYEHRRRTAKHMAIRKKQRFTE